MPIQKAESHPDSLSTKADDPQILMVQNTPPLFGQSTLMDQHRVQSASAVRKRSATDHLKKKSLKSHCKVKQTA